MAMEAVTEMNRYSVTTSFQPRGPLPITSIWLNR